MKKTNISDIDFVSLISHQLSAPLTGIHWNAVLLRTAEMTKPLDKEQAQLVDEIILAATRMTDLLSNIHDSMWLEQGKFVDKPSPTSLDQLVAIAQNQQESEITHKRIKFTTKVGPKLPEITARPSTLTLIVQNLISNAIKYTPARGTVHVQLRTAASQETKQATQHKDSKFIFFSVADTGLGIPQEEQAQLFTKFFRAQNVRSSDINGAGLGLYITALAVKNLGGAIWFESKENHGSTFSVILPF